MKKLLIFTLLFLAPVVLAQDTFLTLQTHDDASVDEWSQKYESTINKAAGDYSGIVFNAIETAAPGADNRLLELMSGPVGGLVRFKVDSVGNLTLAGTVDGIDIATDVAANTLKVSNSKKVLEFVIHNSAGILDGSGWTHQALEYGGTIDEWRISTRDAAGVLVSSSIAVDLLMKDWSGATYTDDSAPTNTIKGSGTLPALSAATSAKNAAPGFDAITQGEILRCESTVTDSNVKTIVVTLIITPS